LRQFALYTELEGYASSGLYAAAGNDKALEKAVYNLSSDVYGAKAGVMRMPLNQPSAQLAKERPANLSRKKSTDDHFPWEVNEPLRTTNEIITTQYPVASDAAKRKANELVQQEVYRADSKRVGLRDRPEKIGDYYIHRETLQPHGDGMQLTHIEKQIWGEVQPKRPIKVQPKSAAKRCMPFGEV